MISFHRSRGIGKISLACLLALIGALLAIGCKKPDPQPDPAPVAAPTPPPAPAAAYAAGDQVDVNWKGSWWHGEVISVAVPKYKIHYVGWSSSWDEEVTVDRLRARSTEAKEGTESAAAAPSAEPSAAPAAKVASPAVAGAWKVGDRVDVNWKGQWWQGSVIGLAGSQYKIHYTGWSASWDEVVPASRLRAPTGSAKKGSG